LKNRRSLRRLSFCAHEDAEHVALLGTVVAGLVVGASVVVGAAVVVVVVVLVVVGSAVVAGKHLRSKARHATETAKFDSSQAVKSLHTLAPLVW